MHKAGTVCLAAAMSVVPLARASRADIEGAQVLAALDRGKAYLLREQSADGTWADMTGYPGGVTALCTLALLSAGVPPEDPHIQKALATLRKIPPSLTYCVALQTMVFCAAEPKKDMLLIQRNVRWLEDTQIQGTENTGAWSYPRANGDNSNTQFALLALHEAAIAGAHVSNETWQSSASYWKRTQNNDGSWGYIQEMAGSGSMTCAGIAALVITNRRLKSGDARVVEGKVQCCGGGAEDDAIERGLDWMGRHFSVHRNPGILRGFGTAWLYYYLYGVERVGRMTAQRLLGGHDWYREGAEKLIRDQDSLSGYWKGTGHAEDNPHIATSFALLFLSKGRRPVLVAKLMHGPGEDWNNHRNDLANLTAYTEKRWEKDLTWQVINPSAAAVEDLLQAPVLFLNGRLALEFSAREKELLRDYIDRGGFLFAEACCNGDAFDQSFRQLMRDIFPEPEYALQPLPPEHPIWRAEEPVDPEHLRPLWGIEYGCRTSVVYCPADLSCFWELSRSGHEEKWTADIEGQVQAANAMGINVLTYATGREPKHKESFFDLREEQKTNGGGERGRIAVAKLIHPGGCNAAPGALGNLLRAAANQLDLRVDPQDVQISLTDPRLFQFHMVFMHGRHAFHLTPAEREALGTYVRRGGMLAADAICASEPFAASFRQEMAATFPDHSLERIPVNHPMFSSQLGGYDITRVHRRDPERVGGNGPLRARIREVEPHLEGIRVGDRYAVIFSPYDLSCALEKHESLQCNGYTQEDAARIGLNVLLYSLHP